MSFRKLKRMTTNPSIDALLAREANLVRQIHAVRDEIIDRRGIRLTPREREVLEGCRAGKENQEIAAQLCLSVSTVKFYVNRLLDKLGVTTSRRDL